MSYKTTLTVAALAVIMAGPLTAGDMKAEYEAAMAAAQKERKAAAKVGGEWRDIGKFLKQAEAAAAKGDYAKAIKLANKVKFQSKAGQEQATSQANAGNPSYLY